VRPPEVASATAVAVSAAGSAAMQVIRMRRRKALLLRRWVARYNSLVAPGVAPDALTISAVRARPLVIAARPCNALLRSRVWPTQPTNDRGARGGSHVSAGTWRTGSACLRSSGRIGPGVKRRRGRSGSSVWSRSGGTGARCDGFSSSMPAKGVLQLSVTAARLAQAAGFRLPRGVARSGPNAADARHAPR